MNNLGANIRTFRKNKGYTQDELAGMLGVTPQAVSRWESEAGLPDVSMIVPIAQTLGITTDALLGYSLQDRDEILTQSVFKKMQDMEDVTKPGESALRVCEYLAEEANKNPMNYDVVLKYVQRVAGLSYYTDMENLLADKPEKVKEILTDGIRKGLNVIRYSNDIKKINKAHYSLAWIYIHMKDFDNAREHVEVLPRLEGRTIREELNTSLVFFEKGFEASKDCTLEFNRQLFDVLLQEIETMTTHYCYFGNLDEAIRVCDWSESVIAAYSLIPEYTTDVLPWAEKKLAFSKMSAYLKAGEKKKADEVCENYLRKIRENRTFKEEELASIEKEFRDKIYIL